MRDEEYFVFPVRQQEHLDGKDEVGYRINGMTFAVELAEIKSSETGLRWDIVPSRIRDGRLKGDNLIIVQWEDCGDIANLCKNCLSPTPMGPISQKGETFCDCGASLGDLSHARRWKRLVVPEGVLWVT